MARTVCIPISSFSISFIVIISIEALLLTPLILYSVFKSLKLKLPKLFRIIYCITSFMLLSAILSRAVHHILELDICTYCDDFTRIPITSSLTIISYMLSLDFICALYLLRLKLSFENTKHSLSKTTYTFLMLTLFILFAFTVITIDLLLQAWHSLKYDIANYANITAKLLWVWILYGIAQICYNIVLLVLFLKKILKLTKEINDKHEVSINDMIHSAIICTVCLLITFMSTFIQFSFGWIRGNIVDDSNELYIISGILVGTDIFINTLSLQLQFKYLRDISNVHFKCCYYSLISFFVDAATKKCIGIDKNPTEFVSVKSLTNQSDNRCTVTSTDTTITTRLDQQSRPKLQMSVTSYNMISVTN
eukprot:361406_1